VLAPTPALAAARLYGKKSILNYRSGEAEDHLARWKTAVPTIRLADSVIVPSGYLVDVFGRFGVPATHIFNIVDTSRFRFRLRESPRPVFLSNRNFQPLYNVACTIRAFAIIQRKFPDASLVLVGDGRERGNLENLVRAEGLRNVTFAGRVEHSLMHEFYDAADVYLNSPNIDNMPVSIIEAYACGLPIATTDAGGIPYIVDHERTGLIVRRDDHELLAAAAIRYISEPGFAARITADAHQECRKYSWSAVRDQWLAAYEAVYSGKPVPENLTTSTVVD
jgi:glycosyltransferase involved in cell wall biosynthesis